MESCYNFKQTTIFAYMIIYVRQLCIDGNPNIVEMTLLQITLYQVIYNTIYVFKPLYTIFYYIERRKVLYFDEKHYYSFLNTIFIQQAQKI